VKKCKDFLEANAVNKIKSGIVHRSMLIVIICDWYLQVNVPEHIKLS